MNEETWDDDVLGTFEEAHPRKWIEWEEEYPYKGEEEIIAKNHSGTSRK